MEKLKLKRVSILYPRPQSCEEAERWGTEAVSPQSLQPVTKNKRHSQKSLPTKHKDSCTNNKKLATITDNAQSKANSKSFPLDKLENKGTLKSTINWLTRQNKTLIHLCQRWS